MKKILALVLTATLSMGALAETTNNAATQSQQQQAQSQASVDGNQQGVTLNIEAAQPRAIDRSVADVNSTGTVRYDYGTQVIKNTPSVSGPALTTSNDTCMGSTSGSLNIAGLGVGGGSTWTDKNCLRLKNGRELWNMGMKAAALALMCDDADNRNALESTGYVCPQSQTVAEREKTYNFKSKTAQAGVTQSAAAAGEPTDPFIRARKGLAPLEQVAAK